jgi:hypothetical protein
MTKKTVNAVAPSKDCLDSLQNEGQSVSCQKRSLWLSRRSYNAQILQNCRKISIDSALLELVEKVLD